MSKFILVTGAAGFLGTHVCKYFVEQGHKVIGIDNLTPKELVRANYDYRGARQHNVNFLQELGVEFRKEDVRTLKPKGFKNVDYIIHCAAQPAMTIAIDDPYYDFTSNVVGTIRMLNIARRWDIPMVNCSTIHVYGNAVNNNLKETETRFEGEPISEQAPILQGEITPLHASKRGAELYTQAYAETYGLQLASFRLTGMFGERQFGGKDHGWVANFAIRTVLERPITIYGTDKQVRDVLYASDAVKAFDFWFKKGCKTGIYNIGGGEKNAISLKECLDTLKEITGKEQKIKLEPKRLGDLHYFVCNSDKARTEFGWKPEVKFKDGLVKLVNWVEENKELFKQNVRS